MEEDTTSYKKIKLIKRNSLNFTHSNLIDEQIKSISAWKKDERNFRKLLMYILTLGILYIIIKINKILMVRLFCVKCEAINADFFLIEDIFGKFHLIKSQKQNFFEKNFYKIDKQFPSKIGVKFDKKEINNNSSYIGLDFKNTREEFTFFVFKNAKFIYIESLNSFEGVKFDLSVYKNIEIHQKFSNGITNKFEFLYLINKFGLNSHHLQNKSYFSYFLQNLFNIYIFYQIYSLIVWFMTNYYQFAMSKRKKEAQKL
jgi:hypothetical protein